jgi:hypothetical protein
MDKQIAKYVNINIVSAMSVDFSFLETRGSCKHTVTVVRIDVMECERENYT